MLDLYAKLLLLISALNLQYSSLIASTVEFDIYIVKRMILRCDTGTHLLVRRGVDMSSTPDKSPSLPLIYVNLTVQCLLM